MKTKEIINKVTEFPPKVFASPFIPSNKTDDLFTNVLIQPARGAIEDANPENFTRKSQRERLNKTGSGIPVTKCEDILASDEEGNENPKLILLIGKAGIGKSLFCQKLIRDWALDKFDTETTKVPNFKFVCFVTNIELNALGNEEYCVQDFFNLFLLVDTASDVDESHFECLCSSPQNVLLIFDGFDEYLQHVEALSGLEEKYPNDPKIKMPVAALCEKLMKGKMLRGCVVLVTSREADKISGKIDFDKCVEIVGFSPVEVKDYITKYFTNEELQSSVVNCVMQDDNLVSFCHIPALCYLVCLYIEWHIGLNSSINVFDSLGQLYSEVLKIFELKHHRNSEYKEQPIPDEILKESFINKFGISKLAAHLVLEEKITFDVEYMEKIDLSVKQIENVKTSGLISGNRNTFEYCFIDLTIQEYFAACYFFDENESLRENHRNKLVKKFVDEFSQKTTTLSIKDVFLVDLGCGTLLQEKCDKSFILKALKTRHSAVLKTNCCSEMKIDNRHGLVRKHVLKMCKEKGLELSNSGAQGNAMRLNTIADMECFCKALGIDVDEVTTSCMMDLMVKGITEDQVIAAYLKQAAVDIQNMPSNTYKIHSIIPYHCQGQTAVVIYTYNPTPDLFTKDWFKEFLGFPVFVVNLMFIYEVEPPVLPKRYPAISLENQKRYSKIKDEVTEELAKKHSNLSSISVDYRIRRNKLNQNELCLQIGVLTKGIIPLGEEMICRKIEGIPVDVIECSATLCVLSCSEISFWPVNVGVGIGVEGDDTCTGSLGAVVKHNETGKLFILSNAHVLCREGVSLSSSIVQPSQQDYEEMRSKIDKSIEQHKINCGILKDRIKQKRSEGYNVKRLEEKLKTEEKYFHREELLKRNLVCQKPREIATFSSTSKHFVRQNYYDFKASKAYGVDAAIAFIAPDEFEPEDMTEMYQWPNDLKDENGKNVAKITLNGNFKNETEGREALVSKMDVYKCGRTTGVTRGTLLKEINVRLGGSRTNCVLTSHERDAENGSYLDVCKPSSSPKLNEDIWYNVLYINSTTRTATGRRSFSVNGDSGAVVFDEEGSCVGLLFGRIDSQVLPLGGGLATPIHVVFDALDVTLASASDF